MASCDLNGWIDVRLGLETNKYWGLYFFPHIHVCSIFVQIMVGLIITTALPTKQHYQLAWNVVIEKKNKICPISEILLSTRGHERVENGLGGAEDMIPNFITSLTFEIGPDESSGVYRLVSHHTDHLITYFLCQATQNILMISLSTSREFEILYGLPFENHWKSIHLYTIAKMLDCCEENSTEEWPGLEKSIKWTNKSKLRRK